ncbi:unnamed protein product [Euphydryas editha]|uniref:PiggyBac transposable element-derived protein domain-containing protein n=1 Tax=Euphydryas editha TaxID=104508 RepID=A0AAU9UKD0_EUPED|nr:unnamed protein product [Euphydryas editha]
MTYHKLPIENLYWSYDEDVGIEMVSISMPRQRFWDVKMNVHFVNNDEASSTKDKMFKVRPVTDILMNKFLLVGS